MNPGKGHAGPYRINVSPSRRKWLGSAAGNFSDCDVGSMKIKGRTIDERLSSRAYVFEKVHPTISPIGGAESRVLPVHTSLQALKTDGGIDGKVEVAQIDCSSGWLDLT